jgi:hypothetical protein
MRTGMMIACWSNFAARIKVIICALPLGTEGHGGVHAVDILVWALVGMAMGLLDAAYGVICTLSAHRVCASETMRVMAVFVTIGAGMCIARTRCCATSQSFVIGTVIAITFNVIFILLEYQTTRTRVVRASSYWITALISVCVSATF